MEMKVQAGVALIGDVVGSRTHDDRAAMQRQLAADLSAVNDAIPAQQQLVATVGDEFQAMYADVATALHATLRLRLTLAEGLDCRFGLGVGNYENVGRSHYGVMQDGPAWWSARDAIVIAKDRESRRNKTLRTWLCVAQGEGETHMSTPQARALNAMLLCRDQIVSDMNHRQRRLLLGLIDKKTQAELAKVEGISASAVSQTLASSGAYAVLGAHESLIEGA